MKKRRRKTKRNVITTSTGPRTAPLHIKEIIGWTVADWCPDLEAKAPPEQVWLALDIAGESRSHVLRFKSPDSLKDFIETLAMHRQSVWPNAERIETHEH